MTDAWLDAVAEALDVDPAQLDVTAVLDLARDAAHNVERKSAPLTAFLVGCAVATGRGSCRDLSATIGALARNWVPDSPSTSS